METDKVNEEFETLYYPDFFIPARTPSCPGYNL
jgi:hypothetical protein